MKNLKLIFTTSIFITFFSCINGDDYRTPKDDCSDLEANISVESITAIATGSPKQYMTDDIIEAYVTSSDQGGNFYKSISFSSLDGNVGFSIPIDNYNLFTKYEPGRKVFIKMQDRFFTTQNNSTVIGSDFNGGVGRISGVEYQNIITRSCTKINEDEIVKHLTIAQAKNNANLNMLIEFDAVQFTETSLGKTYFDKSLNPFSTWTATNHEISDVFGGKITVRISEFANFASTNIPSGNGKIRGVLTKYGSTYQFMIRTLNDVKLTDTRIDTSVSGNPTEPTNLLFSGADFENWTSFNNSVNSFVLKPYTVQGIGLGTLNTNSLHLNGTPTANEFAFIILASAHGTIPPNPTKITFWVKGTSAKSLSLNIYRSTSGYDVFNIENLTTGAVTLSKAALTASNNGTNSYTGTINTAGQWVKVTLSISDVMMNTSITGDLFALKVGGNSLYDLHIDNIEIQ